jgi:hypothetical protein
MSAYHPPQRVIRARVLAKSRWIEGNFHLPRMHSFLEYIRRPLPFFSVTEVDLGTASPALRFFALRRSEAAVIVPHCIEEHLQLDPPTPGSAPHTVECLIEAGMLTGLLSLLPHVRVSDCLMRSEGYLPLRAASFASGPLAIPGPVPVLFVNAAALVGVSEPDAGAVALAGPDGREAHEPFLRTRVRTAS